MPPPSVLTTAATIGAIAAGVALIETALIPGLVIGGAAVLVPRYLPSLRRRLQPLLQPAALRRRAPAAGARDPALRLGGFSITRAAAKTVTFRVLVTTLDFSANYLVLGELATAAGLSAFSVVVGPFFYFVHEAAWHRVRSDAGAPGDAVTVPLPLMGAGAPNATRRSVTLSRPLAKTITYRVFATTMEFTTNYVVVGDVATAVLLSSFGFVLGPFVYFGHERAWDRLAPPTGRTAGPPTGPIALLPAPVR